jgi:hypothetical protein
MPPVLAAQHKKVAPRTFIKPHVKGEQHTAIPVGRKASHLRALKRVSIVGKTLGPNTVRGGWLELVADAKKK